MKTLISKNKEAKGISLIALVITIIVLIILAGITLSTLSGKNGILTRASDSKKGTDIADIKEQIQIKIIEEQTLNKGNISDKSLKEILEIYGTLSQEEDNLIEKTLTTTKGKYQIKVSDIFNGTTLKEVEADRNSANKPNVSKIAQKTYVTWEINEAGTEYIINDTQTTQPDNWYDYENGQWANIKTSQKGLEAYWVWVPRFEYIVPTSTVATEIEVKFIQTSKKQPDEGYIIHPAFTNEGNGGCGELDGIWVAKFEASSNTDTPDTNYGGGNDKELKAQVKPNVQSWRSIETKNIFSVCRKMTNSGEVLEGSTVDSHMMKNIEWGAVAILSQSKYGIFNPKSSTGEMDKAGDGTKKIWNNINGYNSGKYVKTGYVGKNEDGLGASWGATTTPTDVIEYNKIDIEKGLNGTKGSTTGTVYGIYDMNGGSWEYVAGCINGQENLKFEVSSNDIKYVDLYTNPTNSNINYDGAKLGDTTKETKEWNNDYARFIILDGNSGVFARGRSL